MRELEHAVRAVDRGSLEGGGHETDEDGGDASFKVGVVVRCTPRVRAKFHAARALARRVAGEALPIWACMEAVTAEALSALPVGAALGGDESDCASMGDGGASWAERRTEPAGCETQRPAGEPEETHGDEPALTAANVCAAQGADWVAPLLAVVTPERLGLSPRKARALRRIERAAARCPELRAVVCSVRRLVERATGHLPSEGAAIEWMFLNLLRCC